MATILNDRLAARRGKLPMRGAAVAGGRAERMASFRIDLWPEGRDACVLRLVGTLGSNALHEAQDAFTFAQAIGYRHVVVDLDGAEEISSCILGLMIEMRALLELEGRTVSFRNPPPRTRKALELLKAAIAD